MSRTAINAAKTALFAGLCWPGIALAATESVAIPEPGSVALLLIGVAGLAIGHSAARTRRRPDDEG